MQQERKTRIGVVFALPDSRVKLLDTLSQKSMKTLKKIKNVLSEQFPEIEFAYGEGRTNSEIIKVMRNLGDVIGYVVFNFNFASGVLRSILWSGKPVILISDAYMGSGEFLLEYARALKNNMPVLGVSIRDVTDVKYISKYINLLDVIHKLRLSKLLVVTGPVYMEYAANEYGSSVNIYNVVRDIERITGITIIYMQATDFIEKYCDVITDGEAQKIVEKWWSKAAKVVDHSKEELLNPAKLYLGMKKAVCDLKVDGISIDCIPLYNTKLFNSWPCLGFVELAKEGIVPICEGDIGAGAIMLAMKYLANIPGYINDPAFDMDKDEITYYHCMAPVNPHGFGSANIYPYTIIPAHFGLKKCSVDVELPVNENVTLVGLDLVDRVMTLHTAKIIRGEHEITICATKIVGKSNTRVIAKNWNWRTGWHRVLFYGDWKEELKELATLLKLKVVEEDKELP